MYLSRLVWLDVRFFAVLAALYCAGAASAAEPQPLRVMSYNLWHGGDSGKQPLTRSIDVIQASKAQVVGLQETAGKGPNKSRPNRGPQIAEMLGWHYFDQGNNNGVVSQYPVVGNTPLKHGVKIKLPTDQHVWLFNVHFAARPYQPHQIYKIPPEAPPFPHDAKGAIQAAQAARGHQVKEVLTEVEAVRKENTPIFIVGDFNEPSEFDWTTETVAAGRCPFPVAWPNTRAVREAGFVDAYRHVHPDPVKKPGLTWTPISAEDDPKDHHDRIDFAFVGGAGAAIQSAELVGERAERADIVVRPYPSDHRAVVVSVALAELPSASQDDMPSGGNTEAENLRAWRKPAKERKRRVIFNNDGNEPVSIIKRPSRQDLLDARTSALKDTHVDSIFYCTTFGSFGVFHHHTKVGNLFLTTEGRYAENQVGNLLKAGIDPLAVMVDFCKENDIEIFWTMRMNDTHDGARADYGPIMLRANPLKAAHPEYLHGTAKKRPKHGSWTGVNYGHPEVRELAFRYFEEVCKNYDIDGIELDFFRHPVFFTSVSRGEHASKEDLSAMTELVARLRRMADEVGQKRGRPILIAVKAPDSVEYARAIGLDLERWMADDLIDLYIPGGYFQLNAWDKSVELGHKYGVKVYPSLDDVRVRDPQGGALRTSNLGYRGRAAEAWAAGADGVYLFNLFDPQSPVWREAGDPELLARLDKDYFACPRGVGKAAGGNLPYAKFRTLETLNPHDPKKLAPAGQATATVHLGEPADSSRDTRATLRLRFEKAPAVELLSATFNGEPVTLAPADDEWLEGRVENSLVQRGANQVELLLSSKAEKDARWMDLVIQVRHGEEK